MKSFIISIVLLAVLILSSILHTRSLDELTQNLIKTNDEITASVKDENYDKALNDILIMRDYIESKRFILAATMDHNVINNIDQRIAAAEGFIYANEQTEALSVCFELDVYIKNLSKNYKLKLENIL